MAARRPRAPARAGAAMARARHRPGHASCRRRSSWRCTARSASAGGGGSGPARRSRRGAGFVWAAVVGRFPMRITGHDRYENGAGDMRWRLLGAIPVMSASGDDVTRSAAGRLAGESVLCPSALAAPGVPWRALDDRRATATLVVDALATDVTIAVGDDGRLREVTSPAGRARRRGLPRGGLPGGLRRGAPLRRPHDHVAAARRLGRRAWVGRRRVLPRRDRGRALSLTGGRASAEP